MEKTLSTAEKRFIHELLNWEQKSRRINQVLYNLILILGGAIIVGVGLSTLQQLNDQAVQWFTVPGFLLGLMLIGLYIVRHRWAMERQIFASIIRKFQST
jgi:hypothetical membrane protein